MAFSTKSAGQTKVRTGATWNNQNLGVCCRLA